MASEFFLSPESEQAVKRELDQRQRRLSTARQQATEQQAQRLRYANQLNPNASNQLKNAFATSGMDETQFEELSKREALRGPDPGTDSGGFLAGVGRAIEGAGMGLWNQVVKPSVRGAFTLWDGVQEELIMRPATALIHGANEAAEGTGNLVSNVRETYNEYGDSPLVNLVQGDRAPVRDEQGNVDPQATAREGALGHGLFPGGTAQAASNQERTLEIGGERGNFGRAIAHGIFASDANPYGSVYTPGDSAYDITAGVAQFAGEVALDPVAWGTMGASSAIKGAKGVSGGSRTLGSAIRTVSVKQANDAAEQVRQAGLISSSRRNTVLLDQAERLFKNRKVVDEIAQADEYQIFRRMKMDRIGLGRGDDRMAEVIQRLGATSDPTEVSNILLDAAQRGWVRERGFYKGAGKFLPNPKERWRNARLDKNLPEFRFGGVNPERMVSVENRMEAARDIDGILRLGKVGEAERANIVSKVFRAQGNDEMLNIVDESVRSIGDKMADLGVDPDDVNDLLRAHRDEINEQTGYLLDEIGRPSPPPWKGQKTVELADGTKVDTESISAGLIVNLNKKSVPLPDPTEVRRATAKYDGVRKVYNSVGWDMTASKVRSFNRYLFKFPTLFTRLAYPLRNNLDNQARIAGAGFDSIFTNPRAFFAAGARNPKKFRDVVMSSDEALDVGRGFRTTGGRYGVVDEIIEGGEDVPATVRGRFKDTDEVFEQSIDELQQNVTGVARRMDEWGTEVKALTNDAAGMWQDDGAKAIGSWRTYHKGQKGDLKAWRQQLGRLRNDPIASRVADTQKYATRDELIDDIIDSGLVDEVSKLGEDARKFFKGDGVEPSRRQVNEYVDWIEGHIDNLTGGDTRLRRTLATGDLNGVNFNDLEKNKRIDQILREQYYDRMPSSVMGDTFINDAKGDAGWRKAMDSVVDWMATRPENRFTRTVLMSQVFADDMARLMPSLADDTLRRELVKRAADAGFDDKMFDQIAKAAQDAAGSKGVVSDLDDALDAAKHHTSDQVRDIAFDAMQRSSFQEAHDAFVPFWDAFAEIGQSWGRIFRDNPNAFGRGMQAFQGGRNSGFIYTNEMGEEVFAMPGGGALSQLMGLSDSGRPGFKAPVEGLNLITQGFGPGVGPLVQWATGAFMPKTPDLQWARDIITPYGTDIEDPADLLSTKPLDELTPAWIKKFTNAMSEGDLDPTAWNSAAGDTMKALATSGNYDMSSREGQRRLLDDVKKGTKWTMFMRSALQMGAPTGPTVEWEVETDPDGTRHRIEVMATAFYELLEDSGDYATATQAFIDTYGVEPFWIAQAKNNELVEGPRTQEGFNWIQRHGEAAEKYPEVVGHFVPAEDPSAPPDYGVFQARRQRGELESLTAEQQLALANKTKARQIYNVWRDRLSELPYSQRTRQLQQIRSTLTEQFPGWDADVLGVSGGPDRDRKIQVLEQAVQDEALSDSPVTGPLSTYMAKRSEAMQVLEQRRAAGEPHTLSAESNADLRNWLNNIGSDLSMKSPHFQGVWQTLLSSEVDEA